MKFILFRHAEKQGGLEKDSPLSPHGISQSRQILGQVISKQLPIPTKIYCSPRKRTSLTLSPLAESFKLKININSLLDLKLNSETQKDFRLRIQEFLVSFQLEPETPCIYVCTHQDWIEEFLSVIECSTDLLQPKYSVWPCGQYMYFEKNEIWDLVSFKLISV
ncbi:MAG: histidine phosphatase family protein [Bdellovibrionaceae bacterium]|nr:histidine phosphatase family protein [Pseudobdellovibrionaceae bacterium]